MKIIDRDLRGKKFGLLTPITRTNQDGGNGYPYWVCYCECRTLKKVRHDHIISGNTRSCGCLKGKTND